MATPIIDRTPVEDRWKAALVYVDGTWKVQTLGDADDISEAIAEGISTSSDLDSWASFEVNNWDVVDTTTTYVGQESPEGTWWILKVDQTVSPPAVSHAGVLNNATKTSYSTAWSDRASLTYGLRSEAF